MAIPRINGTLQPVRTKLSRRYDPVKGGVITQEWESAGDNLGGLALQAQNAGMEYSLDSNLRRSRLVMTTTGAAAGFPEKATSTWQLYTTEIQQDIVNSPAAVAMGAGVVSQIQKDVADILDGGVGLYKAAIDGLPFYTQNENRQKLAKLMLHGIQSYSIDGYAARASISLPFLFSGNVPGVSPDSLMAQIIGDIPVGGPNDGILFVWGWRRTGTSRTFSGNNRTEISLEWALTSWPKLLYPTGITGLPA